MKALLTLVAAGLLLTTPVLAANDFTYLVQLDDHQVKTVKVELPEGKSDITIGSSDKGAIYTAQLLDPNGDVVLECKEVVNQHTVPCVGHTNGLPMPLKVRLHLINQTAQTLTISVLVHPSK
jgi:hypothetical protein